MSEIKNYYTERDLLVETTKALNALDKKVSITEMKTYLKETLSLSKYDNEVLKRNKVRFDNILDHVYKRKMANGELEIVNQGLATESFENSTRYLLITSFAKKLIEEDKLEKHAYHGSSISNVRGKSANNTTVQQICAKFIYIDKTHKMANIVELKGKFNDLYRELKSQKRYPENEAVEKADELMKDLKIV